MATRKELETVVTNMIDRKARNGEIRRTGNAASCTQMGNQVEITGIPESLGGPTAWVTNVYDRDGYLTLTHKGMRVRVELTRAIKWAVFGSEDGSYPVRDPETGRYEYPYAS